MQVEGDEDKSYLMNAALGVFAKLMEVIDALQMFDPEDAANPTDGSRILGQPFRLLRVRKGRRDPARWGTTEVEFEAMFKLALS